jgi:tRNA(Ile)-lysidine synthase
LESFARTIRYEWFARLARKEGLPYVATGHTADDQAETVLHRLLRGSGLRGLRGIARRRQLSGGVVLVRPLLGVTRKEVLGYLQTIGQVYCRDTSNASREFTRNRIRHDLLPHLANHYQPAIASVLRRLAAQANDLYPWLRVSAGALLAEAERPRAGVKLIFDRERLSQAPDILVREAFRLVWRRERWPLSGMNYAAWKRLAAVACGKLPAVDLPGGLRAQSRGRVVQLGRLQ